MKSASSVTLFVLALLASTSLITKGHLPMTRLLSFLLAGVLTAAPALSQVLPSANTITGGTSSKPPANSTGTEGNFFLDYSSGNVFGPKTSGQWPAAATGNIGGAGAFTPLGNGATGQTTAAAFIGQAINIKAGFAAAGDDIGYRDGTLTAGTNAFCSNSATFSAADVGKTMIVDYAAASGAPLQTTISGFTSTHCVTLAANATASVANSIIHFIGATFSTAQSGSGSYAPGDTFTINGGTFSTQATGSVVTTQVMSATMVSAGSGAATAFNYLNSICTVKGTTGTGQKFIATAGLTGTGLSSGALTINFSGSYTANPTTLTAEPVTPVYGCSGLTGATISVVMGTQKLSVGTPGTYSVAPSSPAATTATSGSGTGLTIYTPLATVQTGGYTYGTDDTAAINSAIAASNALYAAGKASCIVFPAGSYLVAGSGINTFASGSAGCIVGAGVDKTFFALGPTFSGATFSWTDSWQGNLIGGFGYGLSSSLGAGPLARDFSIGGRPGVTNTQNGLVYYDHNDFALVQNVSMYQMNGSCLKTAATLNDPISYMRESKFFNVRMWTCGNASNPSALITSTGSSPDDGTNELSFYGLDIENSGGKGLVLNDTLTGSSERLIRFFGLRIEGSVGDQLVIGDSTSTAPVGNLKIFGLEMDSQASGAWGINFGATSTAAVGASIDITGSFGSQSFPGAWGVNINAGYNINLSLNSLLGTPGLIVNNSTYVTGPVTIHNVGPMTATALIDPTVTSRVFVDAMQSYAASGNFTPVTTYHDGSPSGGNPTGYAAVDLQSSRFNSAQAATGYGSVISGGEQNVASNADTVVSGGCCNTASGYRASVLSGAANTSNGNVSVIAGGLSNSNSGSYGTVSGGQSNNVGGTDSAVPGGYGANDFNRTGAMIMANGNFSASGDSQWGKYIFRGTGNSTTPIRLTADGGAVSAFNCLNLVPNSGVSLVLDVEAFDHTTPSKNSTWINWGFQVTEGASAATAAVVAQATPTPLTNGTLTGQAISVTADTTNGCFNITYTPPTGNTDTWNINATAHTLEAK